MKVRITLLGLLLIITSFIGLTNMSDWGGAETSWTKYVGNPVLPFGGPGDWDETAAAAPTVIKDGSTYKMWYSGLNLSYRIGYATSPDGTTWSKYAGNPVIDIGTSGEWDDVSVISQSVIKDGATYKMWYGGFNASNNFRIGYATSADGITWTKYAANPVLDLGAPGEWDEFSVYLPTVLYDGMTYKMWYSGSNITMNFKVGYATSSDGITWTKYAGNPVLDAGALGEWDDYAVYSGSNSIIYDGTYKFWYTGNNGSTPRIGYATSPDGITWAKYAGNPVLNIGAPGEWDQLAIIIPTVILDGFYKMWFSGANTSSSGQVGYAYDGTPADTTPPTITNLRPPNSSKTSDYTPIISADYSDLSGIDTSSVVLIIDYIDVTSTSTVAVTGITYTPTTALADGVHHVYLEVNDTVGNNASATWSFIVDATPPIADAGTDWDIIVGDAVDFNGNASSDNIDTLDQLNFTWNITKDGIKRIILYGVAPSYTFDEAGQYKVNLTVRDTTGNEGYDTLLVTVTSPGKPKDFLNEYWWILLIIAIIVIIAVILFLLLRRKRKTPKSLTSSPSQQQPPSSS